MLNTRAFWRSRAAGNGIDAVHSLEAFPWCLYGHVLAARHGVPHIITSHGRYGYIPYLRSVDRLAYQKVLRAAALFITVSDAVRREVLKHFPAALGADKTRVLLNAVDADRVRPATTTSARTPKPCGPPTILSVTRFIRSKGIRMSVEAFSRVREQIPDAEYVIVGPGNTPRNPYYVEIERLIRERHIAGITMTGRVGKLDLAALYARARLLLHTPITLTDDFEAYGLILLEAGLFGLPVVATRSGGQPEVVEDGRSGILVPEGDAEGAARAIATLLSDPEFAARLGQRNRQIALSRNWPSYCHEHIHLYHRVIGGVVGVPEPITIP
jgi:starch synthase